MKSHAMPYAPKYDMISTTYMHIRLGTIDCAKQMMANEGATSFFAGSLPRCVQVLPHSFT